MPKQQVIRKLNSIQESRSPVKNEDRQDDLDRMMADGTLPRGLIRHTQKIFNFEDHTNKLWFDPEINQWRLERVRKVDGETTKFQGTLEGIEALMEMEQALIQREKNEADENNPANWDEDSREVWKWLQTIHGAEYSTIKCPATHKMMMAELEQLRLPLCAEHLERAYVSIIDRTENNFERFFQKRNRLERERVAKAGKQESAQETDTETSARTPFTNLPSANLDRKTQDKINRAKPLEQLRREALFSGKKIQTVPSTGTI